MTKPKLKPCPKCGSHNVAIYHYDSGWKRAECDDCTHISSCEGRIIDAIRKHNAAFEQASTCSSV